MDIWNWVEKLRADLREAGQEQSARLIDELTAYVCDLEVERAEALLPEVKALSRTLNNPWLEIFVRHWEMRNRVGNQLEGETALADAVSLFELANRDDTQACPQSVCVTQDLASCYANVDGPGWVEERIEVCDETLARIDPTWACFHCLSNEKAEALLDDGRGEDALAFLAEQEKKILAAGEEVFDSLLEMRVAILLNLGRAEQALALIGEMEEKVEGAEWNNISQPRRLYKAHGLALLGRDEEALEALLPFSEIAPRYRTIWLRAVYLLLQRTPERNTWDFGGRLQQMLEHYSQKGAHRVVIDVASQAIRLALQRGSVWSARRHLALAEQHAQQLQRDRGASQLLAGLREGATGLLRRRRGHRPALGVRRAPHRRGAATGLLPAQCLAGARRVRPSQAPRPALRRQRAADRAVERSQAGRETQRLAGAGARLPIGAGNFSRLAGSPQPAG